MKKQNIIIKDWNNKKWKKIIENENKWNNNRIKYLEEKYFYFIF